MTTLNDPEWDAFVEDVNQQLLSKLGKSHIVASMWDGTYDVKSAVELGFSIFMDKPIVLLVDAQAEIPPKLARVADLIIDMTADDLETEDGQRRVTQEMTDFLDSLKGVE